MTRGPLRDRIAWQGRERMLLACYAQAAGDSRGRRHEETEHPLRTCFQRDRDRVVHSAAFRRLEGKTQVFLAPESDYYRTRLTHTMEVAQITRTLARILGLNEDLAETVALAHDLGHPPHGHAGEVVLNELMADHGGFEHNRHGLRVIEYLEHPYPAFRGLNLTFETRQCLAKHHTAYDVPEPVDEYGSGQAPLEGQIAAVADAIAYDSHDLDDALAAGLISEEDLADVLIYQQLKEHFAREYPEAKRLARQLRCAKGLIDMLATDAIEETVRRLERHQPRCVDDVRTGAEPLGGLSEERRECVRELERFLFERVYKHRRVVEAQQRARDQLEYLFTIYLKKPDLLPGRYCQRLDHASAHRVVCDYLAGMTDRFCHHLHQQFRNG